MIEIQIYKKSYDVKEPHEMRGVGVEEAPVL
jgi:hypothetical protein